MNRIYIASIYEHFKNTPKKLKIVCDWDEVIQSTEPYALWLASLKEKNLTEEYAPMNFPKNFKEFWNCEMIKYSPYGSRLFNEEERRTKGFSVFEPSLLEKQQEIKNSPNFYQEAPFLTIAEDLLKLIKEDKVEKLVFLSAYDKRKFAEGDKRKYEIFHKTFAKLAELHKIEYDGKPYEGLHGTGLSDAKLELIELQLIGFDNENQGVNKADWVKANASDFDIVIDDNPNICRSLVENYLSRRNCGKCNKTLTIESASGYEMADDGVNISYVVCQDKNCQKKCDNFWEVADVRESYSNEDEYWNSKTDYTHYPTVIRTIDKPPMTVLTPYYPATANQHDERVLLVKSGVSDLKREDFSE